MRRALDYFSDEFLQGLATKSAGFRNKFKYIISELDSYFYDSAEDEASREEFHRYIGSELSFAHPGNLLTYTGTMVGGDPNHDEPFATKVMNEMFNLFDEDSLFADENDGFRDATHLFIGIRCPEECFTEQDERLLRLGIALERAPENPEVVIIKNAPKDGLPNGYFFAAMK